MAQYRLEVQAIRRREGRSAVAAAAYRSASQLHDQRLEMVFDYAAKDGVVFVGIMAPDAAPAWLLDREVLWNTAEAADRRVDSRTAREVLISLPHELTDDQRLVLVREFIAEGLVAKGMIADYAIHRPDAHGDPRNHHAHIMVTTRLVDADGFGFKGRAWDNPDAVRELRGIWAEIQNRHLREHLGPDAPQVTHQSLAGQGRGLEPTVHLGPAASGMERRGEPSDRGETNRRIADRNAERAATPGRIRELEDQLSADQPRQDYPIETVIREFEAIHQTMVRERDGWARDLEAASVPGVLTGREIVRAVIGETARARQAAALRLKRTQSRVERGRAARVRLARWITNPARMIWAKHAELNRLERDHQAWRLANAAYRVRRDWLTSEAGRAYVAAQVAPGQQARETAARNARTLERKIKRADRRMEKVERTRTNLLVARELGEQRLTAPSGLRAGLGQGLREVDRRVVGVLQAYGPETQRSALGKVMRRGVGRERGVDR